MYSDLLYIYILKSIVPVTSNAEFKKKKCIYI